MPRYRFVTPEEADALAEKSLGWSAGKVGNRAAMVRAWVMRRYRRNEIVVVVLQLKGSPAFRLWRGGSVRPIALTAERDGLRYLGLLKIYQHG